MAFYFTWNKIQFLYYRLLGPAWPGLCPSFPLHLMSGSPHGSVIFGHIDLSVTQTYTVVFPTHCSTSLSLLHLFKCYVLKRPPPTTQFKSRLLPRASTMFYLSSFFVPFFLCSLSQYLFFFWWNFCLICVLLQNVSSVEARMDHTERVPIVLSLLSMVGMKGGKNEKFKS